MAKAIKDAVDLPAIAHPVASTTPAFGIGLPLSATLKMIEEVPDFVGWKMTYSHEGFRKLARALRELDQHVGIFGACAVFFHEALALDMFDGTVTGSFNYAMEPMIDHINAWRENDVKGPGEIWDILVWPNYTSMFIRNGQDCILDIRRLHGYGFDSHPYMRPPQPRPQRKEVDTLKDLTGQHRSM